MPYSSLSEARIKKLNGVPLTLAQVNWIANVADGIPKDKVKSPWAVAIAKFKKSYVVEGGSWVKREQESKEVSYVQLEMKEDGRFHIVTVSTAALEDKEEETFDVEAIDYDAEQAALHGDYPEYRVLHKKFLGIGRVEKMYRVGIFAIDEGTSYDDPFSLEVCEKMLHNNDGTWKVSRGFVVHEATGVCPSCGEGMIIRRKHMSIGFRCPSCKEMYLGYKRVLKDVHFKKARTFDVTVTDVPAVPWTSAAAFGMSQNKEFVMTKEQLKEKLLEAGISEDAVDARLKDVSDKQLKEFDDVPDAVLLKELDMEDSDDSDGDDGNETVFVLDTAVLKEFAGIVKTVVEKALDGISIEVPDMEMELKELPAVDELVKEVAELKGLVAELLEKDEKRLKQMLEGAPRAARLRIRRFKAGGDDEDDEDEDEDEDGKKRPPFVKKKKSLDTGDRIVTGSGETFRSMTEAVMQ